MKQPKLLKAMEDLQRFCEQDDLVSYTLSVVDLIKRINYVLHDTALFICIDIMLRWTPRLRGGVHLAQC